jgi:ectoine hydroxylase-related dioxygenase (phytanoyl-CoA dioxygenase family)
MTIDQRSRRECDIKATTVAAFFGTDFQALAETAKTAITPWLAANILPALTLETVNSCWTVHADSQGVSAEQGIAPSGVHVRLTEEDFSALINDQLTPITFYAAGTLDIQRGNLKQYLDWWLLLRAIVDQREMYLPGSIAFETRTGEALDLKRRFTLRDSEEDMREFLELAGFLHIRGVFSEAEMAAISSDIDTHNASYTEGDGKSWWAGCADGSRRVVRMQGFDNCSKATATLLQDDRLQRIAAIPGLGHSHNSLENNNIEALVKPLNVVRGISDLPWHKDCAQGRHSFDCCSLTVGISVTGADAESGQIRMIAGSHRGLILPSHITDPEALGLPIIDVPTQTGDVTLHLSCTLHMAQAPKTRERRVMYTSFRLPGVDVSSSDNSKRALNEAREHAHKHLNDKFQEAQ